MKRLLLSLIIFLSPAFIPVVAAADYNFFGGVDCSNAASSAVCADRGKTDNPLTGPNGLIIGIANVIAFIAGGAAIILILVSSIRFITSGGDAEKTKVARSTLINALIGLAVIVLAHSLIIYVLNSLVFHKDTTP